MDKNLDDPKKVSWLPSWLIVLGKCSGIFLGLIFVLCIYTIVLYRLSPDIGARGQFGDSFGFVNALFAGLAFASVIWAIILQRQELEFQRQELEFQRQEFQKQHFENSFFQLLRFHSEIVNSMQLIRQERYEERYSGRESLSQMLFRLQSIYETPEEKAYLGILDDSDEGRQVLLRRFNDKYEQFFAEY